MWAHSRSELSDIAAQVHPREVPAFAELLFAYGKNRRWLQIDQFPEDIRGKLVAACRSMKRKHAVVFSPDIGVLGSTVR